VKGAQNTHTHGEAICSLAFKSLEKTLIIQG